MSLIPQSFIDDLLDRADIVELIDGRVKLKRAGKNYTACCPFHEEKTPSFTVTPDKQFYYCFGCGASGNAIGFLMDYDRLSFPEAVQDLANKLGLEVPREERSSSPQQIAKEKDRKSIYTLLQSASDFYRTQLRQHKLKQQAVGYLQRRGLSGEIARDFGIGYAPPGWDNLLNALGEDQEDQRLLIESGMLVNREDDNKLYDRFRHRIMFPIRDVRGRVIGFGGRVLGDDKPKYLNSPESPVFHKGEELYGLYEARQALSKIDRLLVVEGYMDVVALAQFGIHYGVATLGTACRTDHLTKAFKYTQQIVFCFDGDNAGRMAARRALEASLPVMTDGRQIKFLFLPEGEDPDTLVRGIGAKKFSNLIDNAIPLEEFFFDALSEDLDPRSMEGKARLSKLAAPHLNVLPKGVYRELMFDHLAKRTGLSVQLLHDLVEEVPKQALAPEVEAAPVATSEVMAIDTANDNQPPPDYDHTYSPEQQAPHGPSTHFKRPTRSAFKLPAPRLLTLLLLSEPSLAEKVDDLDTLKESLAGTQHEEQLLLFIELVTLIQKRPQFTTGQIIGHLQGAQGDAGIQALQDLTDQGGFIQNARQLPDYNVEGEFISALQRLKTQIEREHSSAMLAQLRSKPFATLSAEEKAQLKEAFARSGQSAKPH